MLADLAAVVPPARPSQEHRRGVVPRVQPSASWPGIGALLDSTRLSPRVLRRLVSKAPQAVLRHAGAKVLQAGCWVAGGGSRALRLALFHTSAFCFLCHLRYPLSLPPAQDGWLGAEEWDAQRQLEAACDTFSAWQPAQLVLGLPQDSDFLGLETPRAK